jgi:hypothetical protein
MPDRPHDPPALLLTVGHSNRPLGEFLRLLRTHRVTLVADVRKMPRCGGQRQDAQHSAPVRCRVKTSRRSVTGSDSSPWSHQR